MPRKNALERKPKEVREAVHDMLDEGATYTECHNWLVENGITDVPRTSIWRDAQRIDRIAATTNRSNMIVDLLARRIAKSPESRFGIVNTNLLQGAVMNIMDAAQAEDGTELSIKEVTSLAVALQKLASAEKAMADKAISIKEFAKEEAKEAAESSGGSGGLGVIEIEFVKPPKQPVQAVGKARKTKAKTGKKSEL